MCWCNKNLRTPCCGGINCQPPKGVTVSNETILKDSQLALWQSYTDKKQECENLQEIISQIPKLIADCKSWREGNDCWGNETYQEEVDGALLASKLKELLGEGDD